MAYIDIYNRLLTRGKGEGFYKKAILNKDHNIRR